VPLPTIARLPTGSAAYPRIGAMWCECFAAHGALARLDGGVQAGAAVTPVARLRAMVDQVPPEPGCTVTLATRPAPRMADITRCEITAGVATSNGDAAIQTVGGLAGCYFHS
jgi:hypothetical protein